jgi:hypothetical protein
VKYLAGGHAMNTEGNGEKEEGVTVPEVAPDRGADVELVFKEIKRITKEHGIDEAVFIFTSKDGGEPVLYWNQNHFYDAAKLLAHCMKQFKGKVMEDLDC